MKRRRLSKMRVREIAAGYSATHDVETVPLAEEVLEARAELARLRPVFEAAKRWYQDPDLKASNATWDLATAIGEAMPKEKP